MEKTVTLQETNDNTPMGEVFVGLFDAIALIASNNDVVTVDNHNISNQLLNACLEFYCINRGHNILTSDIENYIFDVSDKNVQKAEDALNEFLKEIEITNMNPIGYFVDEMMCNIKEHSRAEKGLLYYWYSPQKNTIDICVADNGISILGSYVQNQLYLDSIGDNDAKAITLAKKGFSTKKSS